MSVPPDRIETTHLLPRPWEEEIQHGVAIEFDRKSITAISPRREMDGTRTEPTLVLPPLCNAHDHGRGLKTLAYGAEDHALEAWVPATHTLPFIDPYLIAAAAFGRMAGSGIGSVVHCHLPRDPVSLVREAEAVKRAAEDVGIRVAFVVPLRDRHALGYGSAAERDILASLSADDSAAVRARWLRPPRSAEEQVALVEEIAVRYESELFQVQFGPASVERCSDRLLEGIARASESSGRKVHMHLLESKYVRQWADREYPDGAINHLEALGLLSSRLTVAHGTWLRPEECRTLARHGVTVSVNTSSNLRLRSGIAPVPDLQQAGVCFAIGLDALAVDDDDDLFREMRLTRLLHQGRGFDNQLRPAAMLAAATRNGVRAVSAKPMLGELAPGAPPDLLAIRLDGISRDLVPGLHELLTAVHARSRASDAWTLIVDGRHVVVDGRVMGVDLVGIERALHRELQDRADELIALRPFVLRYQQAIATYYKAGGHLK